MKKFILDACCGLKSFWFNKNHPNTIYIDNRIRKKGFSEQRPNFEIKPDLVGDFRDLPFEDKSFYLVVIDPPHIISQGEDYNMVKHYGYLNRDTWKSDIKKGFNEGMRVLKDYGVLIFKWNEISIKKKQLLEIINVEPLFGHPNLSRIPTHWFCFMKIPEEVEK